MSSPPLFSLIATSGPEIGRWFLLGSGTYRIGRGSENDVRLHDARMGLKQLLLRITDGRAILNNLTGHTQVKLDGTFVTSALLAPPAALSMGETGVVVERVVRLAPRPARISGTALTGVAGSERRLAPAREPAEIQQRLDAMRVQLRSRRIALYLRWGESAHWTVRASSSDPAALPVTLPAGGSVPGLEEELLTRAVEAGKPAAGLHPDPLGGAPTAYIALPGGLGLVDRVLIAWRAGTPFDHKEVLFLTCAGTFDPGAAEAVLPSMSDP